MYSTTEPQSTKLRELERETGKSTIRDFKISFSAVDRTRQKPNQTSKQINLNNGISHLDLITRHGTVHLTVDYVQNKNSSQNNCKVH